MRFVYLGRGLRKRYKSIFASLWSGLLLLPFMGIGRSTIAAGILFAGFTLFTKTKDVITSPEGRILSHSVQDRICTIYGMLETTWIKRGFPVVILTLLLITPLTINNYYIDVLTITGIYAI